jgi:drug/metabolite transporter (DMT)-like permease
MGVDGPNPAGMTWLIYVFLTIISWGLYGIFLHSGQLSMGDPANGRYKAFLFVGIAYLLTAVLAPLLVLILNGATWTFPLKGMSWSLVAGVAGAAGAFCVLLAFGARGTPAVVMSLVFAGAPVVNAVVALMIHPPAGGFSSLRWQFLLGIFLAAFGGFLVTMFKPNPSISKKPAVEQVKNQESSLH